MRKYVVPIVALAGIALLSPRVDAANLIIKSRAVPPGHNGSLPVSVTNVGGSTQLWGLDFALSFDTTKLTPGNDATFNAAFTPAPITGSTETPVVVSGTPTVGTGVTNPNLYVGIVRGTSAFTTTSAAGPNGTEQQPSSFIGMLKVAVPAADTVGSTVMLQVPTTYNVANTGNGSTTNPRDGATGATSTATAGDPVASEKITTLDVFPGYAAPATGGNDLRVPLHEVAVGAPGDVDASASVTGGDAVRVQRALAGLDKTTWNDYRRITADVYPANGYVNPTGTTPDLMGTGALGGSYGDGQVTGGDAVAIVRYVNPNISATNVAKTTFPVAE